MVSYKSKALNIRMRLPLVNSRWFSYDSMQMRTIPKHQLCILCMQKTNSLAMYICIYIFCVYIICKLIARLFYTHYKYVGKQNKHQGILILIKIRIISWMHFCRTRSSNYIYYSICVVFAWCEHSNSSVSRSRHGEICNLRACCSSLDTQ